MKIYGPVPSWRLGNSLGVDIVAPPPGYHCYIAEKPKDFPVNEDDFQKLAKKIRETSPDYITFSGEGEPTLNLNLFRIAKKIKSITNIPLAILTNAAFVNDPNVRKGLNVCDLVIAKIDASNQFLFEKINRPRKGLVLKEIVTNLPLIETNIAIQTLLFSFGEINTASDENIKGLIDIYRYINNLKSIKIPGDFIPAFPYGRSDTDF